MQLLLPSSEKEEDIYLLFWILPISNKAVPPCLGGGWSFSPQFLERKLILAQPDPAAVTSPRGSAFLVPPCPDAPRTTRTGISGHREGKTGWGDKAEGNSAGTVDKTAEGLIWQQNPHQGCREGSRAEPPSLPVTTCLKRGRKCLLFQTALNTPQQNHKTTENSEITCRVQTTNMEQNRELSSWDTSDSNWMETRPEQTPDTFTP